MNESWHKNMRRSRCDEKNQIDQASCLQVARWTWTPGVTAYYHWLWPSLATESALDVRSASSKYQTPARPTLLINLASAARG
jgi:hypothetical protein